jgi:hypothetical protein
MHKTDSGLEGVEEPTSVSPSGNTEPFFRSIEYRSTLNYGWVPSHGVEFFKLFIVDLHEKWRDVLDKANSHLAESVCMPFLILVESCC